jgi:hypothetical protein
LLADGLLEGARVGRAWIIDQKDLDGFKAQRAGAGRPWSASSAWAALAVASGHEESVDPAARSRARQRVNRNGLLGLLGRLRSRAQSVQLYGHPSVLEQLAQESSLVLSGASAAPELGADLIVSDFLEAYVRESDIEVLRKRFALTPARDRANIVLRVVEDSVWPFHAGERFAPPAVVAVDLLEADDSRSQRAGRALLEQAP